MLVLGCTPIAARGHGPQTAVTSDSPLNIVCGNWCDFTKYGMARLVPNSIYTRSDVSSAAVPSQSSRFFIGGWMRKWIRFIGG